MDTDNLISEIEAYCAALGIKTTTFGQRAVHQWTFFERLKKGNVTIRSAKRARQYMRDNPAPEVAAE